MKSYKQFLSRLGKRKARFSIGDEWKHADLYLKNIKKLSLDKIKRYMMVSPDNIAHFDKLAKDLWGPSEENKLCTYLNSLFSDDTKKLLKEFVEIELKESSQVITTYSPLRTKLEKALSAEFNKVIEGSVAGKTNVPLYEKSRFSEVDTTSEESTAAVKRNPLIPPNPDGKTKSEYKKQLVEYKKQLIIDNRLFLSIGLSTKTDGTVALSSYASTNIRWAFSMYIHRRAIFKFCSKKLNKDSFLAYMCIVALPDMYRRNPSKLENYLKVFTRVFIEDGLDFITKKLIGEQTPEAPLLVNFQGDSDEGRAAKELCGFFRNPKREGLYIKQAVVLDSLYLNLLTIIKKGILDVNGGRLYNLIVQGENVSGEEFLANYSKKSYYKNTSFAKGVKEERFTRPEKGDIYGVEFLKYYKAKEILSDAGFPMNEICCGVDGE